MTTAERVQAVADYGLTERQARFLVLVMRHAGLCVKRQYAAFAGIANGGAKCNALFDKLERRGHAAAFDCVHNRARLYHVHHRLLYHAIGEADSRYRRPVPARSAAERLMRLDAVLTSPDCDWSTTNPANRIGGTFPTGIDPTGRVILLYLATVPWTDDFRTFLVEHTALLGATPTCTLRVVFPQSFRRPIAAYETVVHDELESPLQAATINDLTRYFFHRRRGTDLNAIPGAIRAFLNACRETFAGARFTHLYKRWLTEREAAFEPVPPAIQEALTSGRARVECMVLPHSYEHLLPSSAIGVCSVGVFACRTRGGTRLHAALTLRSTPFLNPARARTTACSCPHPS